MSFRAPSGIGYSYAAGGSILWSTQPFRWGWDGNYATPIHTSHWLPTETVMLSFGSGFSGPLYLALNFTYGGNLGYSITLGAVAPPPRPVNDSPAAVPVPAAGISLAASLAVLAGLMRRQMRRQIRRAA